MAKLWKLVTTRECARILGLVVTAPERDRDLKDTAKAMEVDRILSAASPDYDNGLEELISAAQKLNRMYAGRQNTEDYQIALSRINAQIEELDLTDGQEEVHILLEARLFLYARDKFLDYKGAPADRRLGPKYQSLRTALEEARQVEVEEAQRTKEDQAPRAAEENGHSPSKVSGLDPHRAKAPVLLD